MKKAGRFGSVPLGEMCESCTLDSPRIMIEPVCASKRQLWSVFWCIDCKVRGLINISVHHPLLEIYQWNEKSPVVQNWIKQWSGWDN
jgi:hypothetical protein